MAGALGDLYRRHPELLPQTPEARSRLANSVVRMLAGFRTPAVMDGADCDFLGQVWPLTHFSRFFFVKKVIDLTEGQINDPMSGKHYSL